MAVIVTPNVSKIQIKLDHGTDLNGDRVIKTKTLSSIKSAANAEDIMAVVNGLVGLQQHTLSGVIRVDYSSISE